MATSNRAFESAEVLDERDARALTKKMTVLDDVGRAKDAPGLFVVVSDSGRSYLVNPATNACECDDAFYRRPDGGCIHCRRVAYATGNESIPAWVNTSRIDSHLGEHTNGEPSIRTHDGATEVFCRE